MLFDLIDQYRGLPKQVYIILIARTVAAMGAFVYSFVTMLLSTRLGLSDQTVSYFLFGLSLSYMPAAVIGGKLADKFNRKHVYIICLLITDTSFFIGGFYCNTIAIVGFIMVGFFCMNMANPVMSAMMMDITNPKNRQESMSLCYLGLNLGIAIGPLIAGFLFENYTSWIFWGQAIINMMAMLILGFGIKDQRPNAEELSALEADSERSLERGSDGTLLQELKKRPIIFMFALFGIGYTFSYAQISYVMPLHLADSFGSAIASKYVGMISSINGLSVFILTPLMVLLFKKNHSLKNIAMAGVWYAIGFGLYSIAPSIPIILALVVVWSTGEVMCSANCGVFIANNAPATHRARFQSIYDIMQGLGRATGPILMGVFLRTHDFRAAWVLVFFVCMASAAGNYFLYRHCTKTQKRRNGK